MRAVQRGLLQVVIVWEALWVLFEQQLRPTALQPSWVAAVMWILAGLWVATVLAMVLRPRRLRWQVWPQALAIPLLLLAGTGVLDEPPPPGHLAVGILLTGLSVALAGLLTPWRYATGWLVISCLVAALVLPHARASAEVQLVLVVIAVGSGAIGVRMSLLAAAAREDRAQDELLSGIVRSRALEREDQLLQRAAQILHEGVLNTLAAIVAGGAVADERTLGRLRARARQSRLVVNLVAGGSMDLDGEAERGWLRTLEPSLIELDILGVRSKVVISGEVDAPPLVRGVLMGAVSEAISNVQRHAQASTVSVRVEEWRDDRGAASISAEIVDDGIGFQTPIDSERYGLDGAIRSAVAGVGGEVDIRSRPGAGTSVRILWHQASDQLVPDAPAASRWELAGAFVRPVMAALLVLSAICVVGGWTSMANPLTTGLACALAVTLALALLLVAPRRVPPAWLVILIAAAGPVIVLLQINGEPVGSASVLGDWSSVLVLGLLVVVAAIGPAWAWVAALASWAACQLAVDGGLSWPGVASILLAGLFGRAMQRSSRAYVRTLTELAAQETAGGLTLQAIADVQHRFAPLARTELDAILGGIADGTLEAGSPQVRRKCAALDGYIRALLRLEPQSDVLHAVASEAALQGTQGDCIVDIALPPRTGWAEGDRQELGELARACVSSMQGSTLRITGGVEDEHAIARLVASFQSTDAAMSAADALRRQLAPQRIALSVTADPSSDSVMVELRDRGYFANEHSGGRVQPGAHR